MGTEGGLSRFDGTHFRNFSMEDGLPDIEVLQIFADSRGRIWMGPFSKSICFYYGGHIHNQENDSVLRKIRIIDNVVNFAEDREGNILAQERTVLHLITPDGRVQDITHINGMPFSCSAVSTDSTGHFLLLAGSKLYRWSGEHFDSVFSFHTLYDDASLYMVLNGKLLTWQEGATNYCYRSLLTGKTVKFSWLNMAIQYVSISVVGDSLIYRNTGWGTVELNLFTGAERHFSIGTKISRTFRDDEGNTWFTSLGRGIFRLNSEEIRDIPLPTKSTAGNVVFALFKKDNELMVGASNSMVYRLGLPSFKDVGSFQTNHGSIDETRYFCQQKDGRVVVGSSLMLFRIHEKDSSTVNMSVKTACLKNDSELLVGNRKGIFLIDLKGERLRAKEILWNERATALYYLNNTIYVGTLDGLYVLQKNKPPAYWGDYDPLLKKRISSIVRSADSTLWVATYGGGIVAWKNGARRAILTHKEGLSSDICRVLYVHDNILWVGTDKGLNRVDIGQPGFPVTIYTAGDGLGSDIINAIYVDSSNVYVGTPAGLSYFDVSHPVGESGCRLALLGVISSGKNRLTDTASLRLPYTGNNIRFEYAGISYRSAGNISYCYRLLGLDSTWRKTKESFLEYPTLPSGDYELQIQAVNKFRVRSLPLSIHFTVITPFWKTVWFDALVVVFFLFLTWLFVTFRIKQIRRRQAEQDELNRRLAETEHMALQSQMNPHFIFNCLNSIQQYIFDQEIFTANKYITGFAKLIRATLHNSSKPFISLADEIEYLSGYLSLEKLRFKDKMNYTIEVEPSLRGELEDIHIPPMLMQPYVENCMRHGLRHKTEGEGNIGIKVMQEGVKLAFIVEDNGIGRAQASRYKTQEHIEYQSRGMSLTADRIRLINTAHREDIQVEVIDLMDPQGCPSGTRVIVRFPRFDLFLQKNNI
jgi:ligand-binding sensor domain-containing protein